MNATLTAVVIEDEEPGRKALTDLMTQHVPQVNIVAFGVDIESGVAAIMHHKPDVVFLDINLANRSGFDIIRQVPDRKFSLVITSAYEEYALEAFKMEALDYLLKPVTKEDLLSTIKRIRSQAGSTLESYWPSLAKSIESPTRNKIAVPSANGLVFVPLDQLLRCEAEGAYTKLILKTSTPVLTTRNLGEYEKILLPAMGFLRIHNSAIINLKEVVRYIRGEGGQAVMTDGVAVDISRRKKSEFMEWMEKI